MPAQPDSLQIHIPAWVGELAGQYTQTTNINARMGLVIEASRQNVERGTGGPFAAAVFEQASGRLVALGVNLVTNQGLSVLHAEIVALSLAQTALKNRDLGDATLPRHELFASTEPCAMCLGAVPWSGIVRLVTAAHDEDARRIGFDEGHKPKDWEQGLQQRGIELIRHVQREQAKAVLDLYQAQGGVIYNSHEHGAS